MLYYYQAYGLTVQSSIELPALVGNSERSLIEPICVGVGLVPTELLKIATVQNSICTYNEDEFKYEVASIARYYVANGVQIVIEPLCENWDKILLYLYSNCLAAALLQRNLILFHVSGILTSANKAVLFAASSKVGKSTTALMLQQKGYAPFTDDTALITVENNVCYAQASYPMARLWQNTIELQTVYDESDKQNIYAELDKYGFSFHDNFESKKIEVAGVVFLEEVGNEIKIKSLKAIETIQLLSENIYRRHWLNGMNKGRLQFEQLTSVANVMSAHKATRPQNQPTFEVFAATIEQQILKTF